MLNTRNLKIHICNLFLRLFVSIFWVFFAYSYAIQLSNETPNLSLHGVLSRAVLFFLSLFFFVRAFFPFHVLLFGVSLRAVLFRLTPCRLAFSLSWHNVVCPRVKVLGLARCAVSHPTFSLRQAPISFYSQHEPYFQLNAFHFVPFRARRIR